MYFELEAGSLPPREVLAGLGCDDCLYCFFFEIFLPSVYRCATPPPPFSPSSLFTLNPKFLDGCPQLRYSYYFFSTLGYRFAWKAVITYAQMTQFLLNMVQAAYDIWIVKVGWGGGFGVASCGWGWRESREEFGLCAHLWVGLGMLGGNGALTLIVSCHLLRSTGSSRKRWISLVCRAAKSNLLGI